MLLKQGYCLKRAKQDITIRVLLSYIMAVVSYPALLLSSVTGSSLLIPFIEALFFDLVFLEFRTFLLLQGYPTTVSLGLQTENTWWWCLCSKFQSWDCDRIHAFSNIRFDFIHFLGSYRLKISIFSPIRWICGNAALFVLRWVFVRLMATNAFKIICCSLRTKG